MKTVHCKICENKFLSDTLAGEIDPWNCPKCNKDSEESIQRDLNELYKIVGLNAIDKLKWRIDRLQTLSNMLWKRDTGYEGVLLY